jgi:hypothetical protein
MAMDVHAHRYHYRQHGLRLARCGVIKASFVSTGSIPIEMDKYNKKIMIIAIRDSDLFRVEN